MSFDALLYKNGGSLEIRSNIEAVYDHLPLLGSTKVTLMGIQSAMETNLVNRRGIIWGDFGARFATWNVCTIHQDTVYVAHGRRTTSGYIYDT